MDPSADDHAPTTDCAPISVAFGSFSTDVAVALQRFQDSFLADMVNHLHERPRRCLGHDH